MTVRSITAVVNGMVAYANNDKQPFEASFDSKVQQLQVEQQEDGQVPYSDSDIVTSINTALGSFALVGAPIADPGKGAVNNINLRINCQVVNEDNSNGAWAIVFEKIGATEVARFEGDLSALENLVNDATFLATFNTVLQNAIGSTLVALG
jgi:hypothetical protein